MTDIYSNPQGLLPEPEPDSDSTSGYGSLAKGIAGDYTLSIAAVLTEAWLKTAGAKWTVQIAFFIYTLVAVGILLAIGFFLGITALVTGVDSGFDGFSVLPEILAQLVCAAVLGPMSGGLFIIGLRRSVGAPISAGTVMNYFSKIVPITIMVVLMYVLISIGFLVLIVPGIYLSVAYYLALPLVVEKNLGPWAALEASRKAITKRWFTVFGLLLVLTALNAATVFTLFIGMIWTLPMSLIALGIVYRNIFGVEPATVAA